MTSPLRPADDAVIVDTSELGIDEVVEAILDVVERTRRRLATGDRRPL